MSEQPRAFKGVWIPKEVWESRALSLIEKVMLVEISSLQSEERGCYASNAYFAAFFDLSKSRVSEVISELVRKGLVVIQQIRDGLQVVERQLRLTSELKDLPPSEKAKNPLRKRRRTPSEKTANPFGKDGEPPSENSEGSNTSLSNTGINPVSKTGEALPPAADAAGGAVLEGELLEDERQAQREPLVIEANGKRFEIPGELRYPGPGTKSHKTWVNYALKYHAKYGDWPLWNATIAGQLTQFINRVGEEVAPKVAAFYVACVGEQSVTRTMHDIGSLLKGAERYYTQYRTNRTMTDTRARQEDQHTANQDAASEAKSLLRQMREKRGESHEPA